MNHIQRSESLYGIDFCMYLSDSDMIPCCANTNTMSGMSNTQGTNVESKKPCRLDSF